ncbi:MAG: 1-acyl-sn-glycerol-3-phosphate acyltransferase [Rhodobacter sp.]|nr:1-acyl-sn-glycerol-3-phosphate acyltransferase [Rhodobacter sp.]
MAHAVQWLRSLVFVGQMYGMMALMALFFTPPALVWRPWAFHGVHTYCRWVRWTARWMVGLRSEVRGEVPTDEVLIASKHQSFLDIILLCSVLPRPKFIMKQELRWAPILGWYALRIGCIPVDRGKRGAAVQQMVRGVEQGRATPGQLIIYPQGTRVAPGAHRQYKVGSGILYEQLGQDCVPAATNVGVFWPRRGIYRKPGLAVVEFLPRIHAGMEQEAFMKHLEEVVEDASDRLMAEAGFEGTT